MEGGALSEEAFAKFAKDYILLCHVTTHVETDRYQEDLMMAAGGEGWPHLAFLDAAGELIGMHDGDRTVEAIAETGAAVTAFLELKARVEAGDAAARPDLLVAQIGLGLLSYAEAKDQADNLEMTAQQAARVQAVLFDLEVLMTFELVSQDPKADERMLDLARMWLDEARKGRSPVKELAFFTFWRVILQVADPAGDVEAFRLASKQYHARFDDKEGSQYEQVMMNLDARLKELEKKASEKGDGDG